MQRQLKRWIIRQRIKKKHDYAKNSFFTGRQAYLMVKNSADEKEKQNETL